MALIRQADTGKPRRAPIALDLGDLALQAEHLQAVATARAKETLERASAERLRLISGGHEKGHAEGLVEGREQGRQEGLVEGRSAALEDRREALMAIEAGWSGALGVFTGERDRMLMDARRDVVLLALALAERIVKRVVEAKPEIVADQAAAVLGALAKATRVTLVIHPEDEPILREAMTELTVGVVASEHVELVTDGSLERGSCVARTPAGGEIDASIRTQLDRMACELLGRPVDQGAPT